MEEKDVFVQNVGAEPQGDARVEARPDTVPAVLRAAADLIEPPGRWTQGFYARDAQGRTVYADADEAVCFCTVGAIARCAPEGRWGFITDCEAFVRKAVRIKTQSNITTWNDAPGRTQAEVVAALRNAAALADGALEAPSTDGKADLG